MKGLDPLQILTSGFKIHLFHSKYSSNVLPYLLKYRLRLTDIKINKLQCTFLII